MAGLYGVMSTYRPNLEVIERAIKHASVLDQLVIVDDGSPESSLLDSLNSPNIRVIKLEKNSGIACALNTGMRLALSEHADFVMTLDQDSILDTGYVDKSLNVFAVSASSTRIGIVLTDSVNLQPSIPPCYSPEGFGLVDEGIQSGMIISSSCLSDIGFLDERLFIDCVDTEYCLRARDFGWNIAVAPGTNLIHSLGELVPFKPFGIQQFEAGKTKQYQYHPPFRRYYIVRNNIDLCLRNLRKRPRWVLSVLRREITPLGKVLLSGPSAQKHWLATAVGTLDGLLRRRGKIPNWLSRALTNPK